MGVTLSHQSALDVLRLLRSKGINAREMDSLPIACPSTWVGKRWTMREFNESVWQWPQPSPQRHMHVVVPKGTNRIRMSRVDTHEFWAETPYLPALWLDEHASMVCPELLFLQMAEVFPLPVIVMLGYELCGNFSRDASDPLEGPVELHVPQATSVECLGDFLQAVPGVRGVAKARLALRYVSDYALSAMEAVLATMYSLPPCEAGYGMGPIALNERVCLGEGDERESVRSRYPDLSFSFAPLGINYDGEGHLDLPGLVLAARKVETEEKGRRDAAKLALEAKMQEVRAKVVDDNARNRQLASRGKLVFPVTKEDVYGWGHLDGVTRDVLACAREVWGIDTSEYEQTLSNTEQARDRYALLVSLLPSGSAFGSSYGRL